MGTLARQYLASLQENRPTMHRELERSGQLEAAALAAEQQAEERIADLILEGTDPMEAQQQAMRDTILQPDETEVPSLTQNPFTSP